eukprot:m.88821 g.88821  ORF g.88821 m.88821 type:complete len:505 (-) comp14551_c2_seq1:91-1605(-)
MSTALPSAALQRLDFHELERIRRKSGIADLLPSEPPKQRKDIHMLDMPAHAARASMLSSGSGFNNYRGLYNLALIALFAFGFRLVMENIRKYGLLISPASTISTFATPQALWGLLLVMLLNVYILGALFIEKAAAAKTVSNAKASLCHWINIACCMIVANTIILLVHPPPIISFVVLFETVVVWMKLISYKAVNEHFRLKRETTTDQASATNRRDLQLLAQENENQQHDKEQSEVHARNKGEGSPAPKEVTPAKQKWTRYPDNLTIRDMYYFMLAPTLCYELNFPRSPRIRLRFLVRRSFEVVFLFMLIVIMGQQWVMPTVENTFKDDAHPSLSHLVERTLKLSVPNNIIWLCMFFFYFHSFLNAVGELMRFADRQFYRDWWNATSISYFWKNWNIPVHKWAVRHVYRPLTSKGYSRLQAQLVVFMFSAVMHEVLVSVPLGLFRAWSFLAMLAQVPLVFITDKFLVDTPYGNVVVWSSLFFGQPMAIMLYVQAYMLQQSTEPST